MKHFFEEMNPTVRGFLIIAVIVLAIVFLGPVALTFSVIWALAQILFLLAIAYVVYRWWREHRGEIDLWPRRAKWAFYAAWWLIMVELALASAIATLVFHFYLHGMTLLAWLLGVAIAGYAMWRIWSDEHTYS